MARMHARKKGRSSSTRPYLTKNPEWVQMSKKEVEDKILELNKEGKSTSEIGIILRDQHAVPNVKLALGKSITQVLKENGVEMEYPEDLINLMMKAVKVAKHLEKNPKDIHNKRSKELIEAKIRRIVIYYRGTGVLPNKWKYTLGNAKLIVGE